MPKLIAAFIMALALLAACDADEVAAPEEPAVEPAAPEEPEPDAAADEEVEPGEDAEPDDEDPQDDAAEGFDAEQVIAEDAEGLAVQLEATEEVIRDEDVHVDALADTGHLQQLVYRRMAADAELAEATLDLVDDDWQPTALANLRAGAELAQLTEPAEELPDWRIVAPPPADELLRYYQESEAASDVSWAYLAAIHLVETRMSRIEGTSVAGAQGPMQFMPATWDLVGEGDVNDDRDAIMAAGRYLAQRGAPEDMDQALFGYNNSQHYVNAISAYAEQMLADPNAFRGYYHWQVYYRTVDGDVLLAPGYDGG